MKATFTLLALTLATSIHADDSVRSAAYKASDEQSQILSSSGAIIAELDALLQEMERNGITDDTKALIDAARAKLEGARDGSISAALAQLREVSQSGKASGFDNIIAQQQQAEIALRKIASEIAKKQFTEEIAAKSSAILSRLDRALKNSDGAAAEQQAIALQIQELTQALANTPADLPPAIADIAQKAIEKAKELDLTAKADAAATAGDPTKQTELRDALAEVDQVLSEMIPTKERLENAAKAIASMQAEQAKIAAAPQADPAQAEALATQAEDTAQKVASESPTAAKALEDAAKALEDPSAASQTDAAKALAEAAKAIAEQLAREKAAEETSLADAAESLRKMAYEAAALAAAAKSPTATTPEGKEAIATKAEALQNEAAPLAPEAAATLADAQSKMESGDATAAAEAFQKSAEQLAAQSTAAQAAAAEEARLANMQAAIDKATASNQDAAAALESATAAEAAAKAQENQAQIADLAAKAAQAAAQAAAQPTQAASAEAIAAAAAAAAEAAAAAAQSAQAAAEGKGEAAQAANAQTAESLAAASEQLSQSRSSLRSKLGLPSQSPSSYSENGPMSAGAGETPKGPAPKSEIAVSQTTSPGIAPQRGFPPAVRQAMSELRKTPVPSEFSGTVQGYFEKIAAP
jgi:trimeric autotransporter adhesin